MAPTGFQGLVNKWVKISRTSSHSQEWSKPEVNCKRNEEFSTKTAETSTIDSLFSQKKVQEEKPLRPTLSRRSSSKKLTSSNSYTDLLRRKNEEFRRDCPAFELEVSIPIENQLGSSEYGDDAHDYSGVSVEQLFNPLTTTHVDSFLRKEKSVDSIETCKNCCDIHEKVQDYAEFTKFLQNKDNIPCDCEQCNDALATAIEAAKSLNQDQPLLEISCDSTKRNSRTSLPVPILHNDASNQYVEESLALMESSRRLFEVMNLHKERMACLTKERNGWQENLDQKLSQFSVMCQSIRQEISSEGNAMQMLQDLEAQIGQLKSEQAVKASAPVRVYQNVYDTVSRHTSHVHKFDPGSPPENLHCTNHYTHHHRKLSGCSTSSDALSSISDSSHTASVRDDFMFSLDDD